MSTSVASSVSTSQELVRFLLSRLAEDEAQLKRLARHETPDADAPLRSVPRLQTELAVKRRLIGSLQHLVVLRDQPLERAVRSEAGQMLRLLAVPYEDCPGYRREWRPAGSH